MRNTLIALILAAFVWVPIARAAEVKILGKFGHWEVLESEGSCTIEHDGYTVDGKRDIPLSLTVYGPRRYLQMPTWQALVVRGEMPERTRYVSFQIGDTVFDGAMPPLRELQSLSPVLRVVDTRLPLWTVIFQTNLGHALEIGIQIGVPGKRTIVKILTFDVSQIEDTFDLLTSLQCIASRAANWNYENLRAKFGSWSVLGNSRGCYMEQRNGLESVLVKGPLLRLSDFINSKHEMEVGFRTYQILFMDRWDPSIRIDDGPWFKTNWVPRDPNYYLGIGQHTIEIMKRGGKLYVEGKQDAPEDQPKSIATFSLDGFKEALEYISDPECS